MLLIYSFFIYIHIYIYLFPNEGNIEMRILNALGSVTSALAGTRTICTPMEFDSKKATRYVRSL